MKKKTFHIFLACYAAYAFIYVARVNLSMAAPALKDLQILTTSQIGLLGSMFSVIYACGRLLSGIITDKTAPWKMICFGLILCGLSNLSIGFLPPFAAILLLWGINAFAQSMLWGAVLRILSAVYPEDVAKKRASYMGTAVASGNLIGILLNTELINRFGAQWAFLIPGGITLLLSGFVLKMTHRIIPSVPEQKKTGSSNLLRHKELQKMLLPALVHGIMKDNISLWMTVYIMDRFGIDLEQSSYYVLLIPIVGILGRFLAPTFFRFTNGKEKPLLVFSFILCAIPSVFLIFFPTNALLAIIYLSFIYFAVSVLNACFLAFFPIQFAETGHVATVSGILDFATYLGTGLSAMIYGSLIDTLGYNSMFLSWAILSLLMLPLLINRKHKGV